MNSKKWSYAVSLAAIAGGIPLVGISIPLGFACILGGGFARKALEESVNAKRRPFGTSWLHYAMAAYSGCCCVAALYLAFSGYWQENGLPSALHFIALASPAVLVAAIEERRFYSEYIASADSAP
jgi:hypothetical protein